MRKKLFAVIMSAMMMITFMPTMAFAAWNTDKTVWDEGLATESAAKTVIVGTSKVDGELQGWDGKVYRVAVNGSNQIIAGSCTMASDYWYDLEHSYVSQVGTGAAWGSAVVNRNYAQAKALFGTTDLWNLDSELNVTKINLTKPEVDFYIAESGVTSLDGKTVSNAKNIDVAEKPLSSTDWNDLLETPTITTPNGYDKDLEFVEDQPFELSVTTIVKAGKADFIKGEVPSRNLNVTKSTADKSKAVFTLAGNVIGSGDHVAYNGKEVKFCQKALEGVTSTYQLKNKKTGKYETVSADSVKVKNVGLYQLKITTKDSKGSKTQSFHFYIDQVCDPAVEFKGSTIDVAGTFDAYKYLDVTVDAVYDVDGDSDTDAEYKAAKKAINADKKQILAYVKEAFNIELEDQGDGVKYATIEPKELDSAAKKALKEKYADILGNYDSFDTSDTATFKVIDNITFTKAPLAKTYKAKKGKLPKNKTFYVKAKAASGSTLVYKIKKGAGKIVVNANTGKVTVKKGLKKGTYKVGVYAVTVDTFNETDKWVEDHYTLKIKVK